MFIAVMLIGLLPVHGEWRIYDEVIRLHVLANSDSDEDQALKLKVRDRVITEVESLIGGVADRDEALGILLKEENLERLRGAAEDVIAAEGYGYSVSVAIGEESYPRKNYEALCFPSGSYTSLRVQIGEAEGQNWWCVLFPQLCLGVSTERNEEAFVEVGFTPEQYKIVTDTDEPEYEIRFKILEVIEGMLG
jgi:stage II sporulation protein R